MDNGWWVVLGVLAFVFLYNLGLILSALRSRQNNMHLLFGKGLTEMLNPWKAEDEALDDLHEKVQALMREKNE
jgi:hypothetical protein